MLQLTLNFAVALANGTDLSSPQDAITVPIAGSKGIKYDKDITTSDGTFDLGSVGTIGFIRLRNRAEPIAVSTPNAPSITNQGSAGSTTWDYKIVGKQDDGVTYSAASPAGITTTGNATLDNTNFNRLTWAPVAGAASYDVYRTSAGGTPSTTGLIGNTTDLTFDDTGLAGDSSTAPSVAADNVVEIGPANADYPLSFKGGEVGTFRWNAAAIHHKASTKTVPVEITILED